MDKIKKFFEKKKTDKKFKGLGAGHSLTAESPSSSYSPNSYAPTHRVVPTASSQKAGQAALSRFDSAQQQKGQGQPLTAGQRAIRAQVRKELEASSSKPDVVKEELLEAPPASQGVYFICPLCDAVSLPKSEIQDHLEECIFTQGTEDPALGCINMIYTLHHTAPKPEVCIEVLCRYLGNLIDHPGDPRFLRIRLANKAFQERVIPVPGAPEILEMLGYQKTTDQSDGEEYYEISAEDAAKLDRLKDVKTKLETTKPLRPKLDRCLKVLAPSSSQSASTFERLPDGFYNLTIEDIRKEQSRKSELAEQQFQLRTKAMREKDEIREIRKYKYCSIRVKFPDGFLIQGTFGTKERVSSLFEFVRVQLVNSWQPFQLLSTSGDVIGEDGEATLEDVRLVPATVVIFRFEPTLVAEMASQGVTVGDSGILRPDVLARAQ